MAKMNRHINVAHGSRTPEQKKVMEQIDRDGVCPFCVDFCQGNPPRYHTKPILKESSFWSLTENFHPYEGTSLHLVLIAKRHITRPSELTADEWADVQEFLAWIDTTYHVEGGALLMRFGNTEWTGGSVEHLHAQIIVGGPRESGAEPLLTLVAYKKPGT